jgi:hypothetical protein
MLSVERLMPICLMISRPHRFPLEVLPRKLNWPNALCAVLVRIQTILDDNMFVALDKMFKQHARGIRTSQEVVDCALGLLAYKAQFELVEPVVRLLGARFAGEVKQWVASVERNSDTTSHWMPYNDSRLVSEFYGGIAGGEYTPEQHSNFVHRMRDNVRQMAIRVRDLSLGSGIGT